MAKISVGTKERIERVSDARRSGLERQIGTRLEMPAGAELRLDNITNQEIRAAENDGDPIGFKGVAAVFDKRTRIGRSLFGWFEEIRKGTFVESIGKDDVRMLKNHNTDLPLARNTADPVSLRLSESDKGLETDADMDPTSYAKDLAISLARRTVSQMSFGFEILKETWITLEDDDPDKGKVVEPELRIIEKVKLWEVSPVTFPAYVDTEAALRARDFDVLMRTLSLDDEGLHVLAAELRSGDTARLEELLAARGLRLVPAIAPAAETAPAIAPTSSAKATSSDQPAGRSRRDLAAALFPSVFGN